MINKNTTGFKPINVVQESKWVQCPDYKTISEQHSWFWRLLFGNDQDNFGCVHSEMCENYEYSEMHNECVAGYWEW